MPYTSVTVRDIVLLCFPPDDAVFAGLAREHMADAERLEPDRLEAALRDVYPRAVVRARHELASLRGGAWYAYRDGRLSPFSGDRWWEEPGAARLVVGEDGAYLDATDEALRLLGVDLETLRMSASGSFTVPEYRAVMPWIRQLLRDSGEVHSTSIMRPADGRPDVPVEFRFVRDADGPGRHVAWMRQVPADPVEASG